MGRGESLFTKDFLLVAAITLCSSLNYFTILINITAFAITSFGASTAEAGASAGLYVIGGLASRLLLGKYVELVGRKRMLTFALICALLMSFTYFFVSSLTALYAIRLLHGITYGIASTCTSDIIARIVPPSRRGEGLGYYALGITFSTAVGPLLGMMLSTDYSMVFIVGVVMYSLALIFAFLVHVPEESLTEDQIREAKSFSITNMLQLSALPLAVVTAVFFLAYSGVLSFISAYAAEIDMVRTASFFYIAVSLGTLLSRLTTGKVFDTRGPNGIITLGYIMFIIGMVIFSRTTVDALFLLSGFGLGYGMSIVFAVCQASVISMSPVHRYGVTTSTFSAIVDLGSGLGPMILGILIPMLGYRDMYFVCAILGAVSLVMYWAIHGRKVLMVSHNSR